MLKMRVLQAKIFSVGNFLRLLLALILSSMQLALAREILQDDFNSVGTPMCKVDPDLAEQYPECAAGLVTSSAARNTCGMSTVIPQEKIGLCPDAQAALDLHNEARARRGAAPLLWSKTLADYAQAVAGSCVFSHSDTAFGENLAIGTNLDCASATKLWIDEERKYDNLTAPGFTFETGHFTQVIWKDTLQVGCGYKVCPSGRFVVCQYYPSGNWIDQFADQVGAAGETPPCTAPAPPAPQSPLAPQSPPATLQTPSFCFGWWCWFG